jgi:predicted O-methyltransferase YrrM
MRLSGTIPPDSPAAQGFHRALLAIQGRRNAGRAGPAVSTLAAALADAARGRPTPPDREWLARIEARRTEIPFEMVAAENAGGGAFAIGPGTAADEPVRPPTAAERLGQAWEVCRWASIPPIWGHTLFRLVRAVRPAACLELGTGLGLSGAYQAAALELNGHGKLTTVDVNKASDIAGRGFAQLGLEGRIRREKGWIDELLPALLDDLPRLDYAFLDAEHSYAATTRHFDAVLPRLAPGAVVVLDDIHQTEEMRRAWSEIIRGNRVAHAIPLRRIGVLVIGDGSPA